MTKAAEEFDRTLVLRRVSFHREIPTASLEGYWERWDAPDIRNDPSTAPALMADEYAALVSGEAVLQLPDGSRLISLAALCSTDVQALRDHRDPWLPAVMLNAATLDPRRGFCTDCRSWVDLAAEDAEADRVETESLIEPLEN